MILNHVVSAGLGFAFWMIVALLYTEREVGWGSAVISAMILLSELALLGFASSVVRFLPKAGKPVRLINFYMTWASIIATVIAVIFVAGLDFWSPALNFVGANIIFSLAFVLFVVILALCRITDSVFLARRRTDFILYRATMLQVIKLFLPVLLVIWLHTFGIAASWGVAAAVSLLVSFFIFLPRVQKDYRPIPVFKARITGSMWRYSAGSYFTALFSGAPRLVLPLMVVNLLGPQQNAYFYISWLLAAMLFSIPTAVSQSLVVEGVHAGDKLGTDIRRSLVFTFILLIPALILLFVLGKWLLLLFGGGYSENGLQLIRVLGFSSLLVGINMVYSSVLRVQMRITELVVVFGLINIGTVIGSYFIIPATGIVGVGYVWLIAQGITTLRSVPLLIRTYRHTRSS